MNQKIMRDGLGAVVFPVHTFNRKSTTMSARQIALGVVIGMAAGAALGVLFAPDKGSVTRKKLSKKGSRYMSVLEDTAGEYVENLEEGIENVREAAVDLTDKVKEAMDSLTGNEPPKRTRRT